MALTAKKALAIANQYTEDTVIGGGAIKGKNCTIDSIEPISGGQRVTFKWTLDDGTEQTGVMDVMNGIDGQDGKGIKSVAVNEESHLIITYTDDTTYDAGAIEVHSAVDSVNGKTGEVTLDASDVGALPDNTAIPSKTSDLTNDSNFVADANYVHTDNNYDATAKGIVDGVTTALDGKVDKVSGKGLSKNDYTDADKAEVAKVADKAEQAEVNDIVNVLGAKNLLKVPYHHNIGVEFPVGGDVTNVGITYTHNADHSIKANGTSTGGSYCIFNRKQDWSEFDLYGKEVTLSVSPVSNSVFLQLYDTDNSRMVCRTDSSTGEVTFTFPAELKNNTSWNISINFPTGAEPNNTTYYSMLRLASIKDDTYVPYAPTNAKLNEGKMSYADNGVLGAKNLLQNTATSQTINNVAFTVNSDDKTVNVTRTAEQTEIATRDLYVVSDEDYKLLAGKTLLMTGCPSGGSNDTYYLECYYNDGTGHWLRDIGNGLKITFPATKPTTIKFLIGIKVASVVPSGGLTFKPMIRLASDSDDTYQPYAMTNRELTEVTTETLVGTLDQNDSFAVMKCGKIVTLVFTNTTWSLVKSLTLPAKYRPPMNIAFNAMIRDGNKYYTGVLTMLKTGVMNSYYEATYGADRVATPDEYLIYGTFTYITN